MQIGGNKGKGERGMGSNFIMGMEFPFGVMKIF